MDPLKAGWTALGIGTVAMLGTFGVLSASADDAPSTVRIQPAAEQVVVTPSPSAEPVVVTTPTAAPIPAPVTSTTKPAAARTVEPVTPKQTQAPAAAYTPPPAQPGQPDPAPEPNGGQVWVPTPPPTTP